jgi:hypothetical protein
MTERDGEATERRKEALDELEEAREDAAAIIVQRQPVRDEDVGAAEERIVDAVDAAEGEEDPRRLERLAQQADKARDEIKRQLRGPAGRGDEDEGH